MATVEFENSLVVAGAFTAAGGVRCPSIARWDGHTWHAMGAGLEGGIAYAMGNNVLCLTLLDGALVAGGGFTRSGDTPILGVARWSGTRWEPLGTGIDGIVADLTVFGGDLVAIWREHDSTRGGISRWNGTAWTRINSDFRDGEQIPAVPEGRLAVYRDQLYAGGSFDNFPGVQLVRMEGSTWVPVPHPPFSTILAMHVFEDRLFVGCNDWPSLMSWDGAAWEMVGGIERPWLGAAAHLSTFEGRLLVGGWFAKTPEMVDAEPYYWGPADWSGGVLLWDGHHWESRRLAAPYSGVVTASSWNGTLVVGGDFDRSGSVPVHHLACWSPSGWQPLGAGSGLDGTETSYDPNRIEAFAEYRGELIAAGRFERAGAEAALSIARWDGLAWRALDGGIVGVVYSLAVHDDHLIVGGAFTSAGGVTVNNVAAWDGTAWRGLGTGLNRVSSLVVHDGMLMAATAGGVKRWDGTRWQWLSLQSMSPKKLLSHEGELYVTGSFSWNQRRGTVARWNGSAWENIGLGLPVIALLPIDGGFLASTQDGVLRWDGSAWSRWSPPEDPQIGTMAYHGGALFAMADQLRYWDGAAWHPLGSHLDASVNTMTSFAGSLYLGGSFSMVDDIASACIARWQGGPLPTVTPAGAVTRRDGTSQENPRAGSGQMTHSAAHPTMAAITTRSAILRAIGERSGATIEYDVAPQDLPVQFHVYDVRGRLVRALNAGTGSAGHQILTWDGDDTSRQHVPHGVYFLQMRHGELVLDIQRIVVSK